MSAQRPLNPKFSTALNIHAQAILPSSTSAYKLWSLNTNQSKRSASSNSSSWCPSVSKKPSLKSLKNSWINFALPLSKMYSLVSHSSRKLSLCISKISSRFTRCMVTLQPINSNWWKINSSVHPKSGNPTSTKLFTTCPNKVFSAQCRKWTC